MSEPKQGESLTPQELSKIYYDLNKQYYGNDMVVDQGHRNGMGAYSAFLHTASMCTNTRLASRPRPASPSKFWKKAQPAVDRYLGFLKSGGSDYSINILKKAGVDMSSPEPIEQAMSVFEELISQMEQLTK